MRIAMSLLSFTAAVLAGTAAVQAFLVAVDNRKRGRPSDLDFVLGTLLVIVAVAALVVGVAAVSHPTPPVSKPAPCQVEAP